MALNSDIQTLNKVTELQKKTVTDNYNAAIDKAKKQYAEQENLIDAQKYINERQIAEQMDNLGLTDSGLNRTQQTAVQLSASNNRSKIARQRQEAVDALILEMNSKLTDLETQRLQSEQSIRNSYEQAAAQAAASARSYSRGSSGGSKTTTQKAESPILYGLVRTTDNGDYVFRDNKGKTVTVSPGVNPYTNTNNAKNKDLNKYGFFSNGYQPKGFIAGNYDSGKLKDSGLPKKDFFGTGRTQTIWKSTDGRLWVWNGAENQYVELTE